MIIGEYRHKRTWKIGLFSMAVIIGVSSVVYTNYVVKKLAGEEYERIKMIVDATQLITTVDPDNEALGFLVQITRRNTHTPVIITDTLGNIMQFRNLDSIQALDTAFLMKELKAMQSSHPPLPLKTEFFNEILYYGDSSIIKMLRYYPYLQLVIISLFIFVSYLAFSASRRFEQNQVWVGMSKETAHQLGTPLSSLMAWVEYLRGNNGRISSDELNEIEKDVLRLEVITERFSKVGSQPILAEKNIYQVIHNAIQYLQLRVSKMVIISIDPMSDQMAMAEVSTSLFEWVIENLVKNAVDAMEGKGRITFYISAKADYVVVDVIDTGKGIPLIYQKTIFNPGYTTRKRGWGLGLSLAKRIIEVYHKGQIFVANSEIKKGTTFRIRIPIKQGQKA